MVNNYFPQQHPRAKMTLETGKRESLVSMTPTLKKIAITVAFMPWVFPLFASADVSLPNPAKLGPILSGVVSPTGTVLDIVVAGFIGFATLIAVFAFGFLIFSGFKLILARDNPEALTAAKNALSGSILGFIAALLSVTIILSVSTLLGGTGANELLTPNILKSPIKAPDFLSAFIQVTTAIILLAGIVCILMVIYAGFRMIFSSGNEEQVTAAKTILKWAIAGLAVVIFSFVIIYSLNRVFTRLPSIKNDKGFVP